MLPFSFVYVHLSKARQQAQNGVSDAKSHVTKPRLNTHLNYSFGVSQEWKFKLVNQELLVSTSEVICPMEPSHPQPTPSPKER